MDGADAVGALRRCWRDEPLVERTDIGEILDDWLDDDANLEKYESSDFSASDRRILLAQWYCKAYRKACNKGVRKYFEHAGALMTADGSGDDLIKLEGVPTGHKFTF